MSGSRSDAACYSGLFDALMIFAVSSCFVRATGIIGTNIIDALQTVKSVVDDVTNHKARCDQENDEHSETLTVDYLRKLIPNKQIIDKYGWKKIDQTELDNGKAKGKTRQKFSSVDEILLSSK